MNNFSDMLLEVKQSIYLMTNIVTEKIPKINCYYFIY